MATNNTSGMFRLEVLVPDRNLAEVLRRLSGVAQLGLPQPVVELPSKGGDVVALLRNFLDSRGAQEITRDGLREFQSSIGRAPGGVDYLVRQAVEQGVLKLVKRGKPYIVQRLLADMRPKTSASKTQARDHSKKGVRS